MGASNSETYIDRHDWMNSIGIVHNEKSILLNSVVLVSSVSRLRAIKATLYHHPTSKRASACEAQLSMLMPSRVSIHRDRGQYQCTMSYS